MKKNIFFKLGIASFITFASLTVSACWYKIWKYNDYIYGINNFENHIIVQNINNDISY
jgi:hypothetical protein